MDFLVIPYVQGLTFRVWRKSVDKDTRLGYLNMLADKIANAVYAAALFPSDIHEGNIIITNDRFYVIDTESYEPFCGNFKPDFQEVRDHIFLDVNYTF
ncbi:hypothetical protein D3C71_1877510 [compost metagenome]